MIVLWRRWLMPRGGKCPSLYASAQCPYFFSAVTSFKPAYQGLIGRRTVRVGDRNRTQLNCRWTEPRCITNSFRIRFGWLMRRDCVELRAAGGSSPSCWEGAASLLFWASGEAQRAECRGMGLLGQPAPPHQLGSLGERCRPKLRQPKWPKAGVGLLGLPALPHQLWSLEERCKLSQLGPGRSSAGEKGRSW